MNEETKNRSVEKILEIADHFELSRNEMEEVLKISLQKFDELAIIPQKRRCSRCEREHLA